MTTLSSQRSTPNPQFRPASESRGRSSRVALTMGDPCGIGPEIILCALATPLPDGGEVVIFGDMAVLQNEDARLVGLRADYVPMRDKLVAVSEPDAPLAPGQIGVLDVCPGMDTSTLVPATLAPGFADPRAATLQLAALDAAIEATRHGRCDAICTAPWTKSLFSVLGMPAIGHTERLAEAFGAEQDHVMMLAGDALRVALVTTHLPLSRVSAAVTHERLADTIRTTARDLTRWYGVAAPHIAICGLNPHAGESGHMGMEEIEVIAPCVEAMRAQLPHVTLSGPLPPDTLFARYHGGKKPFDAVVCMYHDQGLIPLKLLHFGSSANITLGLPILRTSVDHGTAYDIAGKGIADPHSMRYALELAQTLVSPR
jgi:4-phospho-D-threonate 3-dehydrogenase / 4-phospho-D-erythronate 3-dehydrogenase